MNVSKAACTLIAALALSLVAAPLTAVAANASEKVDEVPERTSKVDRSSPLNFEPADLQGDLDSIASFICDPAQTAAGPAMVFESAFLESGNEATAFLISAQIPYGGDDRSNGQWQDCSFAVIQTADGSTLNGGYSISATSGADAAIVRTGALSGQFPSTTPIYTSDYDPTLAVTFTANGSQLTSRTQYTTRVVATPKSSKQKKKAKKAYKKAVKKAKAALKKAKKSKKAAARVTYNQRIATAKSIYAAAIATSKTVTDQSTVTDARPYTLTGGLDYSDAP